MKVAVVRNRNNQGIVNQLGQPCPETYGRRSVQGVINALRANGSIEFLPIVELDFDARELHTLTRADKYHKSTDEPIKICPALVNEQLAERLRELSLATFRACHCKDYARVDIRVDPSGNPFVLEINSMVSLGSRGTFVLAANKAGYNFKSLIARILDITHQRYFGSPAPSDACATDSKAECSQTVSLPKIPSLFIHKGLRTIANSRKTT